MDDTHGTTITTNQSPPEKEEVVTVSAEMVKEEATQETKQEGQVDYKRILSIITLQLIILVILVHSAVAYAIYHGVPGPLTFYNILFFNQSPDTLLEGVAAFDYLGGRGPDNQPSFYAILMEVVAWAWAGILARTEYQLTQVAIQRKPFNFFEGVSEIIGNAAIGISITLAVVAFLVSTEFMNVSLRTANIESIAAISFILGFYHEDTRRLLRRLQKRVSGQAEQLDEDERK